MRGLRRVLIFIFAAAVVLGPSSAYSLMGLSPGAASPSEGEQPVALFRVRETVLVRNGGAEPWGFGGIRMEAYLNFSWQRSRLVEVNHDYSPEWDLDGNPTIVVQGPPELGPGEVFNSTVVWEIRSFTRQKPDLSLAGSGVLGDISGSLVNYTRDVAPWSSPPDRLNTSQWANKPEYYNKTISEAAATLQERIDNVLEIVLNDVNWIASNVRYSSASPKYPVETARTGLGDCDDMSNLLIALLRLQGIPSFLMMGQVYLEGYHPRPSNDSMEGHLYYEANQTAGHGWAMVYVPPWGWLPVDIPVVTGDPLTAITGAYAWTASTVVFQNLTGVQESANYINETREQTEEAKEKDIYYSLILDMRRLELPEEPEEPEEPGLPETQDVWSHLRPVLVLAAVGVGCGATVAAVMAHSLRRTRLPPPPFPVGARCSQCGAVNPPDAVFCGHCGGRMTREG